MSQANSARATAPVGVAAGVLSGLLGIGGGLLVSPVLIHQGMPIKSATGTALAVVLPTATVAVLFQLWIAPEALAWAVAGLLALGAQAGVLLAGKLLDRTPEGLLRWLFICFLLYSAARNLGWSSDWTGDTEQLQVNLDITRVLAAIAVGGLAGVTSVFFGVGGGVVMVPGMLLWVGGFDIRAAMATSLLAMIPTAAAGLAQAVRGQRVRTDVAAAWILPAAAGAGVGVALRQYGLGANWLSTLFAVFLLFVAWRIRPTGDAPGPRSPRRS